MNPHAFVNTGAVERPADSRDVLLGVVQAPVSIPGVFMQTEAFGLPIEYQGQQPACGAHAGTFYKELLSGGHYSPRFSWANIKTFDGFPVASGTDMRSIFKSLQKTGALTFDLLGNDVTLPLQSYASPALTKGMAADAGEHLIDAYAFLDTITWDGLKGAIYQNKAVLLLVNLGAEWWTSKNGRTSWAEADILPLRTPSPVVSGHFIVAHSYDTQYIYFENHWSTAWGRNGHGYFDQSYLPFVREAGTAVVLPFDHDLYLGMTDPDVQRLQVTLNKDPRTQVATTGAGSPGHETSYFGSLTEAAVMKYQTLHGISHTGYVGPLTRARLASG